MANQYGNLGSLYETRGDQANAHEFWTKSRDLFAKIGMKLEIAQVQGWIDQLPQPPPNPPGPAGG